MPNMLNMNPGDRLTIQARFVEHVASAPGDPEMIMIAIDDGTDDGTAVIAIRSIVTVAPVAARWPVTAPDWSDLLGRS